VREGEDLTRRDAVANKIHVKNEEKRQAERGRGALEKLLEKVPDQRETHGEDYLRDFSGRLGEGGDQRIQQRETP